MKLDLYLKESNKTVFQKYDNFIDTVRSQCKPWLRAIKGCGLKTIIRGYKPKDLVEIKSTRKNREPVDTPREIHTSLDVEFFKKFGWKVRTEGLFVFPIRVHGGYGNENGLVFPIGDFKFVHAPKIRDLFLWYNNTYHPPGTKGSIEEFEYRKAWAWRTVEEYTNKDLCGALSVLNEISIYCKKYIIIRKSFLHNMYEPPGNLLEKQKFNQFIEDVLIKGNI